MPQVQQVIQIPLQFFLRAAHAGGADDQAHAIGDVETAHHLADFLAIIAFDPPRHAAGARIVGHQHQIAAGQADESGQCRALVAALFLFHLDHQVLAFLDGFPDVRSTAVGDGLRVEVIAGDFLEGQKPVPVGAVIDECRFQSRFDAGDAAFIDVGFLLLSRGSFDIEVVKFLAIHEGHAQLFLLSCVDQHAFH